MAIKDKRTKLLIAITICIIAILIRHHFLEIREKNQFYIDNLGIALPKNSVILNKYSEYGWNGDGEYYSEILLNKAEAEEFISDLKKTEKWVQLPLPQTLQKILNWGDKSKNIPQNIINGMYFVRDRFAEQYKVPFEKDEDIYSRGVYNITISIIDFETNELYIYQLDT